MLVVSKNDLHSTYVFMCNARDKWDLITSFVLVKSYCYLMGSLNEAQVRRTFSDRARKPWWLLRYFKIVCFARFSLKSARRPSVEALTTSCDCGLVLHCTLNHFNTIFNATISHGSHGKTHSTRTIIKHLRPVLTKVLGLNTYISKYAFSYEPIG